MRKCPLLIDDKVCRLQENKVYLIYIVYICTLLNFLYIVRMFSSLYILYV